jgi:PKD repeat protein
MFFISYFSFLTTQLFVFPQVNSSFENRSSPYSMLFFRAALSFFLSSISLICSGQPVKRKALFIGNSYTSVNNLPQITADFAASLNDTLLFDSSTPGGYTFDDHFADTASVNKVIIPGWDYVILQEQSQLPALEEYYSQGATSLCSLISQYNPCARKLFYMTWGRKNGDNLNCPIWPPVCTYEGMDSMLHLRYTEMATLYNGEVSPVGAVWRYLRQNFPTIELFQIDNSHPSTAGSYAAACSFYAMLFQKNPAQSTYNYSLNPIEAAIIRNAAKLIVFDSLQNWVFSNHIPQADFNYSIGNGMNELITTNYSQNMDFVSWDLGDGFLSASFNPVHSYSSTGNYTITLKALNCDLADTIQSIQQKTVNFCPHNPTIIPDSIIDCPDSDDTLWTQVFDSYQWYDENGTAVPSGVNQFFIPSGSRQYTVSTTKNNCAELSPPANVEIVSTGMTIYYVDSLSTSTRLDTICQGDTVLLMLRSNKPGGNDFYFQWYSNGTLINSAMDDTLIVTTDGNYSVKVFNSNYCTGYAFFESTPLTLNFINCNININENLDSPLFQFFPNPATTRIKIKLSKRNTGCKYFIHDLTGKIVQDGILEKELNDVSLNSLNNGTYFLELNFFTNSEIKKLLIFHR